MGLPSGFVVEDPARFPTLPFHHAEVGCFGFFSDNNQQSHHFVLPEEGKLCTFVGCKVTFVNRAISQGTMGAQALELALEDRPQSN